MSEVPSTPKDGWITGVSLVYVLALQREHSGERYFVCRSWRDLAVRGMVWMLRTVALLRQKSS